MVFMACCPIVSRRSSLAIRVLRAWASDVIVSFSVCLLGASKPFLLSLINAFTPSQFWKPMLGRPWARASERALGKPSHREGRQKRWAFW